ncbi:hypothetical protein DUD43_05415 [Alcaligenes faecalis]|nr:hypothetical protein DUD43_05415 [Alcaligenes faecalis]
MLPAVLIFNLARGGAYSQHTQASHHHRSNNPSQGKGHHSGHSTHPNHPRRHQALHRTGRARMHTALAQTRNGSFKSN